jgi:hypothetical protein
MASIILIIFVCTASGIDYLNVLDSWLMASVLIHEVSRYFRGNWSGWLKRMQGSECRTVAIKSEYESKAWVNCGVMMTHSAYVG